jgi:hypothetical protein
MSRYKQDSASLIARDQAEAEANRNNRVRPVLARAAMMKDAKQGFNDPGSQHGPSIKCPNIYEALRKKGYSKEKAARISNSRC